MRDARVVRRLIASYASDPNLTSAWKRTLGVVMHMDTTISDMERRLADLRHHRDAIAQPLDEMRDKLTRVLRGEEEPDKKVLVGLVQQARRVVDRVLDFEARNRMQEDLDVVVHKLSGLP